MQYACMQQCSQTLNHLHESFNADTCHSSLTACILTSWAALVSAAAAVGAAAAAAAAWQTCRRFTATSSVAGTRLAACDETDRLARNSRPSACTLALCAAVKSWPTTHWPCRSAEDFRRPLQFICFADREHAGYSALQWTWLFPAGGDKAPNTNQKYKIKTTKTSCNFRFSPCSLGM
jgi:hypothetical protein